jgi:hypothetical protein
MTPKFGKADTTKIFLATTNLHFVHEFCSHRWVHLFSITGEFTFGKECIALHYQVLPNLRLSGGISFDIKLLLDDLGSLLVELTT